jgi:hypothetical protein
MDIRPRSCSAEAIGTTPSRMDPGWVLWVRLCLCVWGQKPNNQPKFKRNIYWFKSQLWEESSRGS